MSGLDRARHRGIWAAAHCDLDKMQCATSVNQMYATQLRLMQHCVNTLCVRSSFPIERQGPRVHIVLQYAHVS